MENEEKSVVSTVETAPSATDRFGAVMCHTGALIGLNILIPFLFTLFVSPKEKPFLYKHARQALAYQIATLVAGLIIVAIGLFVFLVVCWGSPAEALLLIGFRASLIGLVVLFVYLTIVLAFTCIACGYAIAGKEYTYPFMKKF